jgi:hypothetical protein
VYVCELTTVRARAVVPIAMNVVWNIGYCGIGVLAMYIHNWRNLMLYASAPFLLCMSYYW